MDMVKKIALITEFIIGFWFVFLMWLFGAPWLILMLPAAIAGNLQAIYTVIIIVMGGLGLWGILQLTLKLLRPSTQVAPPIHLRIYLLCGMTTAAMLAIPSLNDPGSVVIVAVLPVAVTAHFYYLARDYFHPTKIDSAQG